MVQANYLDKKAPQIKGPFIKSLHQIPLFSRLDLKTLEALFTLSRFVNLMPGKTLFQQGSFDQSVYFLISGSIEVLLKTEEGKSHKIDTLRKPFSLVGERSILGEPQGVSISASKPSILLGIDMSLLPDVQDYFENQENLTPEDNFHENIALYTILGHVLTQRVDRLIKDQYKLTQKVTRLNETAKSWKTNEIMALIFNQFVENTLPSTFPVGAVIKKVLAYYRVKSKRIDELFASKINTEELYYEFIHLAAIGKIPDMEKLLFTLIKQISAHALKTDEYQKELQHHPEKMLPLVSMSNILTNFYKEAQEAGVLGFDISKDEFLEGLVDGNLFSPAKFVIFLKEQKLAKRPFDIAYLLVLFCKCHLDIEEKVNARIQERVQALNNMGKSKQDTRFSELEGKIKVAINNLKKMAALTT